MSINLILIDYDKLNNNEYTEVNYENLGAIEISEYLYETLIKENVEEIRVWEETGQYYYQRIIKNDKINQTLEECKKISLRLISNIAKEDISEKEVDEKLDELRILLEIRNILRLKKYTYSECDSVFVIVG